MKLGVVGCGYVGLVSGACLASLGHSVVCVDTDPDKIQLLKSGHVPIREPGLRRLVTENLSARRLRFSNDIAQAAHAAEAVFLAVGTPNRVEDGEPDLTYVVSAVDDLAACMTGPTILVSKSTVPVGTGDWISERLKKQNPTLDVTVVACPEFLREGSAVDDFLAPHRIVVGTDSWHAEATMRRIYASLVKAGTPFLRMDRRSAELAKYASNALLATKLAFTNEMADFAESVSADITEVVKAMGLDPRIGDSYLSAGPGFGGSCFPKDAMALHRKGEEVRSSLRIVEAVIGVNEQRKRAMAYRIIDACGGDVGETRIALLGVAFKAGTDDIRDTPAIPIVRRLLERGAQVAAFDPGLTRKATDHPQFAGVEWCDSVEDAVDKAVAAVIVTDWDVFSCLHLKDIARRMSVPRLIDLRNLYVPSEVTSAGLDYYSIGRAPAFAVARKSPRHAKRTGAASPTGSKKGAAAGIGP